MPGAFDELRQQRAQSWPFRARPPSLTGWHTDLYRSPQYVVNLNVRRHRPVVDAQLSRSQRLQVEFGLALAVKLFEGDMPSWLRQPGQHAKIQ